MANQNARLTFIQLIADHDGEWGWYQFERAFPLGWFTDEPPTKRAKEILDELESDGLVMTTSGRPQAKYRLTDEGRALLKVSGVDPTSA
ncbi:MAG: hypothetical protein JNL58_12160 [Planctomyces sp.]|nr:hypothetical protein [Planctomyces sp.]